MATAAETAERIEQLQGMILSREPSTACLANARQTWGVSRAQGYRLIKRAWHQIKLDIDEIGVDRHELLSWSIQTLMAVAGQAMQQKNPGAVVACIRQLDYMIGQSTPTAEMENDDGLVPIDDKVLDPASLAKQIETYI